MAAEMTSTKMIKVRTRLDGKVLQMDEPAAVMSGFIRRFLEDMGNPDDAIPVDNISSTVLAKIVEYCTQHSASPAKSQAELDASDAALLEGLDGRELYRVILGANYLEVDGLRDMILDKVAEMIKGKLPEEIREALGIVNDLRPEDEKAIREKYSWAFEIKRES